MLDLAAVLKAAAEHGCLIELRSWGSWSSGLPGPPRGLKGREPFIHAGAAEVRATEEVRAAEGQEVIGGSSPAQWLPRPHIILLISL